MWLALLFPAQAALPPKDGNGGISLHAWFTPQTYADLGVQPSNEGDYCDMMQMASDKLWIATEGQHYIKNVTFMIGDQQPGVRLFPGTTSVRARAEFAHRITLPHTLPIAVDEETDVFTHEMGHYFYNLPDEYLELELAGYGFCEDSTSTEAIFNGCASVPESTCASGVACVVPYSCWGSLDDSLNGRLCHEGATDVSMDYLYVEYQDCIGTGGTCLIPDPGVCLVGDSIGQVCDSHDDCLGASAACSSQISTETIPVDLVDGDDSCMMASRREGRWCASNHQHVMGPNGAYDYAFHLDHSLNLHGFVMDGLYAEAEDHTCWTVAEHYHADLDWPGAYSTEMALGLPEATDCDWQIDELTMAGSTAVVVDASGSMIADDAWSYAMDGAAFLHEQATEDPDAANIGLYHFDSDFAPLKDGATDLAMGPVAALASGLNKPDLEAHMDPTLTTHICAALESAADELAGVPITDRKVILLTDGKDTTPIGCDPVETAQELCDELGISVHALAYGDADVAITREMTNAGCGAMKYAPPGEVGLSGPLALQMGMAQIGSLVEGEVELLFERQWVTSGISAQTVAKQVVVPEDAETLTLTWMGSDELWMASPLFNQATYTVTTPTGLVYTLPASADGDRARFRTRTFDAPTPGVWTMTLHAKVPTLTAPLQFEAGWLATASGPYQAEAWTLHPRTVVGQPMALQASASKDHDNLTDLEVEAEVIYDDQRWTITLYDDGFHGDGIYRDGIYGGDFVPAVAGPYNVEVTFEGDDLLLRASTVFQALPYEPIVGGTAFLLPDLYQGGVYRGLRTSLQGLTASEAFTAVSLGEGVEVFDLEIDGAILTFDARVSSAAPLGSRDLVVQVGASQYRLDNALDVIKAPTPTAFAAGTLVISEIEVDAEWFEVYNPGTRAVDLYGLVAQDNSGQSMSLLRPVPIPSKGYVRIDTEDTMTLSSADTLKLKSGTTTVDTVSWGSGWPVTLGSAMSLSPTKLNTRDNDRSTSWCVDEPGTPGLANDPCP